jgi:hypothetical protein
LVAVSNSYLESGSLDGARRCLGGLKTRECKNCMRTPD